MKKNKIIDLAMLSLDVVTEFSDNFLLTMIFLILLIGLGIYILLD